jgi:hypothetical protein
MDHFKAVTLVITVVISIVGESSEILGNEIQLLKPPLHWLFQSLLHWPESVFFSYFYIRSKINLQPSYI